jgi:hypothetical protein
LKVAHAIEAAGAVGGVVDASLAGGVARGTNPVASSFITDGSSGADCIASSIVLIISVSTVVAD